MTSSDALNRGFNLLAVSILVLAGVAFGTVGFTETDAPDKIDDFGLLTVGVIGLIWYFVGSRTRRSVIPVALVFLALAVQFLGVGLEHDDKEAFGDNIGGMFLFIPSAILITFQYWRTGKLLSGQT